MAVAIADVQTELLNKGYPAYLSLANIQTASDSALRELSRSAPIINFAGITAVNSQQDYYIFDPAKQEGLCVNALEVNDVYWNPDGDFSSPDIFSPGFQLFSTIIVFGSNTFDNPSDMTVLRTKLDAWSRQFGAQDWKLFGQPGDPAAFIRISPVPTVDNSTLYIKWTTPYTIANITSLNLGFGRYYMQYVELEVAKIMTRKASETAGVEVAGLKSSADSLKFWQAEVMRLTKIVEGSQGGINSGVALRT